MEIDELQAKWAEHDLKLNKIIRLNQELLRSSKTNKARTALQRLAVGAAIEAAIDLVIIVALGGFIYDNMLQARFAFPAIALDLYAIMFLNSEIRQIIVVSQIDYGKPVSIIQQKLEILRILRIRCTQWTFLTAPLVWTPVIIVVLKGFCNLDAYHIFGAAWLSANLLCGLVFIPLILWLSRRFGDRMGRWPFIQVIMRDMAGYNLTIATDFLAKLSEFEDEK